MSLHQLVSYYQIGLIVLLCLAAVCIVGGTWNVLALRRAPRVTITLRREKLTKVRLAPDGKSLMLYVHNADDSVSLVRLPIEGVQIFEDRTLTTGGGTWRVKKLVVDRTWKYYPFVGATDLPLEPEQHEVRVPAGTRPQL